MSVREVEMRQRMARIFWWVAPVVVGVVIAAGTWVWVHHRPAPAARATFAPWALPDEQPRRIAAARLPRYTEKGAQHFHTHLDVFVDGSSVAVPGEIGLTPPYSAAHTHSDSGMIHVETDNRQAMVTLGQFFTVWGVRLTKTCIGGHCSPAAGVRLFSNGGEWRGDPRSFRLAPGQQITLVVGTAPAQVPASYDCHNAASLEQQSCQETFLRGRP